MSESLETKSFDVQGWVGWISLLKKGPSSSFCVLLGPSIDCMMFLPILVKADLLYSVYRFKC